MPVLGSGGRVLFRRPTPNSIELKPEDFNPSCNGFTVNAPGWWNGDLACVQGLTLEGNLPSDTRVFATYQGSRFPVGPNRDHIASNDDGFFKIPLSPIPMVLRVMMPTSMPSTV